MRSDIFYFFGAVLVVISISFLMISSLVSPKFIERIDCYDIDHNKIEGLTCQSEISIYQSEIIIIFLGLFLAGMLSMITGVILITNEVGLL